MTSHRRYDVTSMSIWCCFDAIVMLEKCPRHFEEKNGFCIMYRNRALYWLKKEAVHPVWILLHTVTNNSMLLFKLYSQWCQKMCNEQTKQTSTVLRARKEFTKTLMYSYLWRPKTILAVDDDVRNLPRRCRCLMKISGRGFVTLGWPGLGQSFVVPPSW